MSHYEKLTTFIPKKVLVQKMDKSDEKTNTGEGGKGKRGRTAPFADLGVSLKDFPPASSDKRSLLIRFLLINILVLPYLVDKTISLSTRIPSQ